MLQKYLKGSQELFGVCLVFQSLLVSWACVITLLECCLICADQSFEISYSDSGSSVSEICRQCSSRKFLQAGCSTFGSQAGFLDQRTCAHGLRAEFRVVCWLKGWLDVWGHLEGFLLLRHAKATSSCLCRQIETVHIHRYSKGYCSSGVHAVGHGGHACCWCKVTWMVLTDTCRMRWDGITVEKIQCCLLNRVNEGQSSCVFN